MCNKTLQKNKMSKQFLKEIYLLEVLEEKDDWLKKYFDKYNYDFLKNKKIMELFPEYYIISKDEFWNQKIKIKNDEELLHKIELIFSRLEKRGLVKKTKMKVNIDWIFSYNRKAMRTVWIYEALN